MPLSSDRLDEVGSGEKRNELDLTNAARPSTIENEQVTDRAVGQTQNSSNGIRGGDGETFAGPNSIRPIRRSFTDPQRRPSIGSPRSSLPPDSAAKVARSLVYGSLRQPLAANGPRGRPASEARENAGLDPFKKQENEEKNTATGDNGRVNGSQSSAEASEKPTSAHTDTKVQPLPMTKFHKQKYRFLWPEEKTKHKVFESTRFPFTWVSTIGHTDRALVYAIHAPYGACEYTGQLALKVISCEDDDPRKTETLMKDALTEVTNMDSLEPHHHVVSLLGSYSQDNKLGILMYPVAKLNLEEFMKSMSEDNNHLTEQGVDPLTEPMPRNTRILIGFFPCLIRTLEILHRQNIKHKDIKPQNILVDHFNTVLYSDFGIAKRYGTKSEALTSGPTDKTARYAAGEEPRDFDYDIFSLGCVFLEMATVILGSSVAKLLKHIAKLDRNRDKMVSEYIRSPREVETWIGALKKSSDAVNAKIPLETLSQEFLSDRNSRNLLVMRLPTILKMMSTDHTLRPKFWELLETFSSLSADPCSDCRAFSIVKRDTSRSSPSISSSNLPPAVANERSERRQPLRSSLPLPRETPLVEDVKAEASYDSGSPLTAPSGSQRSTSPHLTRRLHPSPKPPSNSLNTAVIRSKETKGVATDGAAPLSSSPLASVTSSSEVDITNPPKVGDQIGPSPRPNEESTSNIAQAETGAEGQKVSKTVGFMLPINIPDRLDRFPQDPKAGTGFHDSVSTADEPLQTDSTMNLEEPSNSEDRADDLLTKDEPADHLNDVQPGQINRNDSPKLSIQSIFRRLSPLLPEQLNSLIDILEIDRNGDRRRVRTKLKNILGTLILVYNATIGEVTVSTKRQILGKKGFFLHLPRFRRGTNFYMPPHGYVNIWRSLSTTSHWQRVLGMIRMVFVPGDYSDGELLVH